MAENTVEMILRARDEFSTVIQAQDQALHTLDKALGDSAGQMEQTGRKAAASGDALMAMGKSIAQAGQMLTLNLSIPLAAISMGLAKLNQAASSVQVEEAFRRSAAAAGASSKEILSALRLASGGTVSDVQLMLSANRAFALGVAKNAQDLAALMEISRDRARVMGMDVTQAFDNIVVGLGRGSPYILDNLGLVVKLSDAYDAYAAKLGKTREELTSAEQKQALIDTVMQQAERTSDRSSLATRTQAEEYAAMRAEIANTANALLSNLLPVAKAALGTFNLMPGPMKTTAIALLGLALAAGPVTQAVGALATLGGIASKALAVLRGQMVLTAAAARTLRLALMGTVVGAAVVGGGMAAEAIMSRRQKQEGGQLGYTPYVSPAAQAGTGNVSITINNPTVRDDEDLWRMQKIAQDAARAARGAR